MSPVVKRTQGPTPASPRRKASGKNRRNGTARSSGPRPLGATISDAAAGFRESFIGAGFLAAVGIATFEDAQRPAGSSAHKQIAAADLCGRPGGVVGLERALREMTKSPVQAGRR